MALSRVLERVPVNVVCATSGEEALRASLDHDFALAILDVHMPGMNGHELAGYLRSADATRNVPIIFLTATDSTRRHTAQGYESGAIDYIVKPFDPDVLVSKVRAFLRLYEARRDLELLHQEVDRKNRELQAEIERREAVEAELRRHEAELATLVAQRTAALERSNRELRDLAWAAAHDLKSPLRTVASFAGILADDVASGRTEELDEHVLRIEEAVARMDRLLENLMELTGMAVPDARMDAVDLNEATAAALDQLALFVRRQRPEIRVGTLPMVRGDRPHIVRVMHALLRNALTFVVEGRPLVIRVEAGPPEAGFGHVVVRDNGIGFDPAEADRIFRPFARLNAPRQFEGTGIGLSICRKIIELHGGRIWAESIPGEGSAFHFTLPLA